MDILWIKRGKAKCPIPVVGCVGGGEGGREGDRVSPYV